MKFAPKLKVHERTGQYALATFGPVLIQLWQQSTPLIGAQAARRVARELAASGVERTGSVVVVPVQSVMPEKAARNELTNIPADLARGAGLVLVQEGTGFRASAIRAVLSTMMHLSRKSIPHDVQPNVEAGCDWLARRLSIPGGAAALVTAIDDLRAVYAEAA